MRIILFFILFCSVNSFGKENSLTCFWQVAQSNRPSNIIAQNKENSSDKYGHACVLQGTYKALELCKLDKYKNAKLKVFQAQGSTRQSHLVSCAEHNLVKKTNSAEVGKYIQRYEIKKSEPGKADTTSSDLNTAETPTVTVPVSTPASKP